MKNFIFIALVVLFGCKKPPEKPQVASKYENGLVILCEGLFNANNASLSYYSFSESTVYNSVFVAENGRGLGDTANDMVKYSRGGIEYLIICVDVSSQVEILELSTMKSVAQIPLFDGESAREPRAVSVSEDASYAYVANFDGTVSVINLTDYSEIKTIQVGKNPTAIDRFGSHYYVANSGGLDYPIYDSTISVISENSNSEVALFDSEINCSSLIVNDANYLYVRSNGNYSGIDPALLKIDGETGELIFKRDVNYSSLQIREDDLYFYDGNTSTIGRLSMISDLEDLEFSIDVMTFETFGGFYLDPERDLVYCIDLHGYVGASTIHAIDFNGTELYNFSVGLNANTLIKI